MMMVFRMLLALLALLPARPAPAGGLAGDRLCVAFAHVNVLPMDTDRVLSDQTVVIRDGRIISMGPASTMDVPDDTMVIDGRDKYLIPGLADMHAHLEEEEDALLLFVANGVTTVRNMWGKPIHLEWRKQIDAGELLGPTVYTTGPITDGDPPMWKGSAIVTTPDDAERELVAQKQAGYDALKIMTNFRPDVYEAILVASKKYDFPVYGHVPTRVGFRHALGMGQRSFEHMLDFVYELLPEDSPLRAKITDAFDRKLEPAEHMQTIWTEPHLGAKDSDPAKLAQMAAASGAWFCPTIVANDGFFVDRAKFESLRGLPYNKYVPADRRRKWDVSFEWQLSNFSNAEKDSVGRSVQRRAVTALHRAGARLLAGTDSHPDMPYIVFGFSLHEELRNLVEVGLSPYEALKAATVEPAALLRKSGEFGTVAAGMRADLVLLEANPLEDVVNVAKRAGVMIRGKWFTEAELHAKLEALAEKYARQDAEALSPIVFEHVNVVPMDRAEVLPDQTVIVRDGRIAAMGPTVATESPGNTALKIDGTGKYLMPGLADMHTHTWDEDEFTLLIANGVTTIRNMFGAPLHLEWRRRISAGELLGPAIYTSGPIIDGNPPVWPDSAVVENVEQARKVVAEQKRAGFDFLKVYWGLSQESFDAIIDAGRATGMPVVGHVPDAVSLSHALRSGIRSIEHLTGYEHALESKAEHSTEQSIWARLDESRFAASAQETAKAGTWNCPTLVVYQNGVAPGEVAYLNRMLDRPEMKYVSPDTKHFWYPENNYLKSSTPAQAASRRGSDRARKKLVKALHDAGARLLLGTDYPNPFVVPGFSIHDELRNLVDAGLTPYEAIRAGTSGAAEFLVAADTFGTVAVGRQADLILVEANPLEDVANVAKRVGVMVRGRWFTEAELQAKLKAVAAKYAKKVKSGRTILPNSG